MSELEYGQQPQMEDASMVGTLRTQAAMIWPHERPVLERLGLATVASLADLGCGTGQFAGRVAHAWPTIEVTGLDMFEGHLQVARADFPRETHPQLTFVHGDARATHWVDSSVAAVSIRHVLHALPDVPRVLAESRRILEPGGLLYVLAEDYAGLIFDTPTESAQRLFFDAMPALRKHGTSLFHGRAVWRELREAGFVDVRMDPILLDTTNVDRATFGQMLAHWRDGYADFIADAGGFERDDIRERFEAVRAVVLDEDRYACWLLFAVSGRKPAQER
jgi:ubiquinone/menaquinone biosynthesis C-methylase UbiE